ncbi:MAG: hypothetical protein OFPI_26600 [Osedax symbiont Rs2]|nr:MAG: hypothetical protein OFPI_26600 [Osedax symbiont Rs2]
MLKLVLIEKLPGGLVNKIQLSLNNVYSIVAKADASYSVFDQSTMLPPAGLVLKRKHAELEVEVDQQLVLSIDNFFVDPTADTSTAQFSIDGSSSQAMLITAHSADELGEQNIVWQLAEDSGSSFAPLALTGTALGVAAGAGGGSSSAAVVATSSYNMTITAAAGVLESLVTVIIYDKDGSVLASQEHNFSTGPLVINVTNGYRGPLLAKVENSNGVIGDYINEASNLLVDLGTDLRAMASSNGTDDVHINVTPVTELAVRKADISGNTLTMADVATNQKIADLFGVKDILGSAVTVLDTDYDASNGLSAAEKYGNLLAALAGSDNSSGGQKQTLDQLESHIIDTGSTLALTQEGVNLIKQGIVFFEAQENSSKAALQNSLIMVPIIDQASAGLTLSEVNAGVLVLVSGAEIGDTLTLHWGDQVITHTVTQLNAQNSAEITVPSNVVFAAKQGNILISTQINGGERSAAVIINVDSEAPTVSITMADSALKIGETSLVTFTFSETPIGFTQDDISVDSGIGSLSNIVVNAGNDKIYTATFTPSADIENSDNLIRVSTDYTDAITNSGTAGATDNFSIDTKAATVTINMADTALKIGEDSLVTFTFSETPISFSQDDISVDNGSLSNIVVSNTNDKVYTATFTPSADIEDSSNLISVDTGYTDAAGNTGIEKTSDNYSVDTKVPTVTINMADTALKIGDTSLVTFTFSETPINFTQDDISVDSGSLSSIVVNASNEKIYTAIFTPSADIENSSSVISVGTNYTDTAGNTGIGESSDSYSVDTKAPTVTVHMSNTALKIGDTSLVTFTFSETPIGFTEDDINADNGSLNGFTVTAETNVYTATFTPNTNTKGGSNLVSVGYGYEDALGNTGIVGTSENYTIDTAIPTVAITMADAALNIAESTVVTFTFSETPNGFTKDDVTVGNGSLSDFSVSPDDKIYTATFTPNTDIEESANLISVSNNYTNLSGNTGTSANSANYTIDTLAPTVTITMAKTALKLGDSSLVTFTFSETTVAFNQADLATDIIADNGSLSNFNATADDNVYTAIFTPDSNVKDNTNSISVNAAYTDVAGNTGTSATSANYTIDTVAPTVTINMDNSAFKIGDTSQVSFVFSEPPIGFTQEDISVKNGSLSNIVVFRGRVYTATFTPSADIEDSSNLITVGTGYTNAAGNTGVGATSANYSVDTKAPTLTIHMADTALMIGETSIVTFTFSETPTGFTQNDIRVDSGSLSNIVVDSNDDKVYTATFTPSADIEDSSNLIRVITGYTDAAGNTGSADTSTNYSVDTTAPTVTITMSDDALTRGQSALVTFTFSEAPIDFTQSDVIFLHGNLSDFIATDKDNVYTAMFPPPANTQSAFNTISVSSDYTDAAGNSGTFADSANFSIDTRAPTLALSVPQDNAANFAVNENLVLAFDETIQLGSSGNIVLRANGLADIIIDVSNHNDQLSINGATLTINPSVELRADSQYSIQIDSSAITDSAGNYYQGIADQTSLNFSTASAIDTSIVVFDLTDGQSSNHSGREFQKSVDYNIYIKVDSIFNPDNRISIVDSFGNNNQWTGGANLGSGDKIILVGTGETIIGFYENPLVWASSPSSSGMFYWVTGGGQSDTIIGLNSTPGQAHSNRSRTDPMKINIWTNDWGVPLEFNALTQLPAGVATSQGV